MTEPLDPAPEHAAAGSIRARASGPRTQYAARVGFIATARSTHTPRASHPAGASVYVLKEDSMFEGQPQTEVDALIQGNSEFKQLYQRHKQLDKQVLDAELGVLPVDDLTLTQMKREKLAAKDRLTRLYDVLHH
jgi:uncharacterized protein YdcH (DUF465 family)